MAAPLRTIAILVANPALSSILASTLASVPSLRVRPFESQMALTTYLRLAPAEIVITDFDNANAPADRLASDLRSDPALHSRNVQIVALASALSVDAKSASIHAGIDEIIMKPMSPRYLVERVLARLMTPVEPVKYERRQPPRRGLHRRSWASFGDNVVPLFGSAPPTEVRL